MDVADVCDVMKTAISMEEDSERFYREAAETADNPLAESTFEALADWEVEHKQFLQQVFDEAEASDSCPAVSELDVEKPDIRQAAERIFECALEQVEDAPEPCPEIEQAYAAAMAKERSAIEFYKSHIAETDDEDEQALYEFLLDQERDHLNLLATTEEYLNDTKYWHFKQEQWIVTG